MEMEKANPLQLDRILSEFDDRTDTWVLQDVKSKKFLSIPDPRYPGKNPVRFFLRREDVEAVLNELLDETPGVQNKEIYAVKVKLLPALKGLAADNTPEHADSFVVHSRNEAYEWLRDRK
jgi:hypothetical protein